MAHVLIMPRQGNTVESCIITNWKLKEGDTVKPETVVCEVETDKASFEVPAGAAGTVLKLLYDSGDDVPVLAPIAVIGAAAEDWKAFVSKDGAGAQSSGSTADASPVKAAQAPEEKAKSDPVPRVPAGEVSSGELFASPRARNLAAKEALPLDSLPGTGPCGRIIERDIETALQKRLPLTAAAKAAEPGNVPEAGSGLGGRITAADLAVPRSPFPAPHSPLLPEGSITEIPIKGIRKIISDRMLKSVTENAQLTLNSSASAEKLKEIRSRIKTQSGFAEEFALSKITINDLVLFAVSRTLPRFSFMNAHKTGDTIKIFERVHLGIAVDTPKGLMVPVIRNANLLSLAQISSEAKRLAAACQGGSALPDELAGSTFTITNLGSLGISSFTPILNVPEVAILGVCGIEMKPVALTEARAGECNCGCGIRFEEQIGLSLSFNHQAIDGAPAARFLKALGEALANMDLLLAAG